MATYPAGVADHIGGRGSQQAEPDAHRLQAEVRAHVLPAMRAALAGLDPEIERVCAYHQGWVGADGAPVSGDGGKMLRPALALLSARAAGGDAAAGAPAAAAVELVHAFSLLHDDIMDGDTERRHRPTAWVVFGVPMAILAGDALLGLSQSVLTGRGDGPARAMRRLAGDTQRLIGGQRADLAFERRAYVTLDEYAAMAIGKTGALISSACAIGVDLLDGDPQLAAALARCGERLGLAFQVVDDILGIWGDPGRTGKPVHADLALRKKTYPVVAAMTAPGAAAARLREVYLRPGALPEARLPEVVELIERAGGLEAAHRAVDACLDEAHRVLAELPIPREVRSAFETTALRMTERTR